MVLSTDSLRFASLVNVIFLSPKMRRYVHHPRNIKMLKIKTPVSMAKLKKHFNNT